MTTAARPPRPRGVAWIVALILAGGLFVLALVPVYALFSPSSMVSRYARPASSADAPRIWFDGELGPLGSNTGCFGGVGSTFPHVLPITASDGRSYEVDLDHVETARYDTFCAHDREPVLVDGCVSGEKTLVPCEGVGVAVQPGRSLAEERRRAIRESSTAIFLLVWLPLAALGWWGSRGDVGFAIVRRLATRARSPKLRGRLAMGALPAVALALGAYAIGAARPPLVMVALLAIPTAALFAWARTLAGLGRDLESPRSDTLVLEGVVGDGSTVRKTHVAGGSRVAYSLVEVVDAGGIGRSEIPTGGELEIATADGDFIGDVTRIVPDLDVDAEVKLSALQLPRDLPTVPFGTGEYVVRESVLRVGDPITALAPGSSATATVGRGAYRIAPLSASLAKVGPILVFEGSRAETVRRVMARSRRVNAIALGALLVALAATLWALEMGHLSTSCR